KKVKKLLGKAKPEKRAAHIQELLRLFTGVCDADILLIYIDEVHIHRDLDLGYTWGRRGQRIWRTSDCPKLSDRLNAYGAYDFTNGECLCCATGKMSLICHSDFVTPERDTNLYDTQGHRSLLQGSEPARDALCLLSPHAPAPFGRGRAA